MIIASVDVARFVLNGVEMAGQRPVDDFHAALGKPTRVVAAGRLAPAGHRNNQIHYYDEAGLYLIEHHYTYTIYGICFVLWRDEETHKPTRELSCEVRVGGVLLRPGLAERELLASTIPFEAGIARHWSWKNSLLYVGFEARGRKNRSGRRGSARYVSNVSVSFHGNPFDDRYRPR